MTSPYDNEKFSKSTFNISVIVSGLLLVPNILTDWAEDVGTLGVNIIWLTFANLFYVYAHTP